jgi:hypothetical protein
MAKVGQPLIILKAYAIFVNIPYNSSPETWQVLSWQNPHALLQRYRGVPEDGGLRGPRIMPPPKW